MMVCSRTELPHQQHLSVLDPERRPQPQEISSRGHTIGIPDDRLATEGNPIVEPGDFPTGEVVNRQTCWC